VAAPILAGGVHRATMIGLMATAIAGSAAFALGLRLQHRALRIGWGFLLPVAFLIVAALQSFPVPLRVRALFDPAGTALLRDAALFPVHAWPLSLDPPSTRAVIGRAAAALVAFLIGFHVSSGQSRRHLICRAIAVAGVTGVAIAVVHRILGVGTLYGVFTVPIRSLLVGPFVNANHNAEFFELTAFVCLACSFQRPTALNRIGWLIGTALCAGAAAATLSRGAALALALAVVFFAVLRHFGRQEDGAPVPRRASLARAGLLVGIVVLGALALGADQLVDRFKTDAVSNDVRFRLWRESLRVLAAHPFGIGRGAFDRVFPAYRTFRMPFALRFAFVENEPLQILIDVGWFFFALIIAAAGAVVWQLFKRGRRDKIEAALCAGLFAVLVHGTLDFGLETLGVLLPFSAILGTVLGRLRPAAEAREIPRALGYGAVGAAVAGLLVGVVSLAHRSSDNFDALLKQPLPAPARKELLVRAQQTHPLDYFYVLSAASLEPLAAPRGSPSPRLHALNRALRLCPSCELVHAEVGRNLWRLGLRPQALLEWRTAVEIQPGLYGPALGELFAEGATPPQLAAVAGGDGARMLILVNFLTIRNRLNEASVVLDQVDALGKSGRESYLARAQLQLAMQQPQAASATLTAAHAKGIQDPRMAVLEAQILLAEKGAAGADEALVMLDTAATRDPTSVQVQYERIQLITRYKKWKAADRAIEGYKLALYAHGQAATDAHIFAARLQAELGRLNNALDEYRIALMDRPSDVSLWLEYGRAAQSCGRIATAREAYSQAARLAPDSPDIANARKQLDADLNRALRQPGDGPADGRP
jgi:hypothetical protein